MRANEATGHVTDGALGGPTRTVLGFFFPISTEVRSGGYLYV